MLNIHHSCKSDRLITILRVIVAVFFIALAILSCALEIISDPAIATLPASILNSLLSGAVAYGVYTKPHKYSSFAVVILLVSGSAGAMYSYMYLTEPIEGRESFFSSITQWYITFSVVAIVAVCAFILYYRSRYLFLHNKQV